MTLFYLILMLEYNSFWVKPVFLVQTVYLKLTIYFKKIIMLQKPIQINWSLHAARITQRNESKLHEGIAQKIVLHNFLL